MKFLLSLLVKHLAKKGLKSATVWATTAGAAAVIPFINDIPEQYRGYVLLAYAGVILLGRLRGELAELYTDFKARNG